MNYAKLNKKLTQSFDEANKVLIVLSIVAISSIDTRDGKCLATSERERERERETNTIGSD